MEHRLVCAWCQQEFRALRLMNHGKPRRFCGTSCSAKWRTSQPEYKRVVPLAERQAQSQRLELQRDDPTFQAGLRAYLNSNRNPFRDPDRAPAIRAKATATSRSQGFPQLNKGNGHPLPVPVLILAQALGWITEFPVSTGPGGRERGYSTNYKIDIAEPSLKIAVEVDGEGHKASISRRRDALKDAFLESEGWTVVRVTNKEVLADTAAALQRIMRHVKSSI